MKFYFFGGEFPDLEKIYDAKFDGNLFLYNSSKFEHFTELSYNASKIKKDFKYMVAIRPYAISPQYLAMICKNIYKHFGNILEINLISGWPKLEERLYNAFVGEVSDSSSSDEKTQYLIKYLELLSVLKKSVSEISSGIYVSSTNKITLESAVKFGNGVIVPYHIYMKYSGLLNKNNLIVTLTPVITNKNRTGVGGKTDIGNDHLYGTEEEIVEVLAHLKSQGVYGVLLAAFGSQQPALFRFVTKYKDLI